MNRAPRKGMAFKVGGESILPEGFLVGHAQDDTVGTGCTVILCEDGALSAVSVRGAAPATVETDLLDPSNTVERINAVLLSGGSAFGIEAASGAMKWLTEKGKGFCVSTARVPIVCGAALFDLTVGQSDSFPDKAMGYAACEATSSRVETGNIGAGTGASVGKLFGESLAMKTGFGCASVEVDGLIITALVAVNAVGNVFDRTSGRTLAGVRDPDNDKGIADPYDALISLSAAGETASPLMQNTTIGCVLTNGTLTKAQAKHVADMTHDGYARAIEPVHTGFDGDAVFALSTCTEVSSPALIGSLAALVMEKAIHNAALSSESAYGLPSSRDLNTHSI